jgi:beta-lactamase class A
LLSEEEISVKRDGKTPVVPKNPRNQSIRRGGVNQKSQKTASRSQGIDSTKVVNNFWASVTKKTKSQKQKSKTSKHNTITGSNQANNSTHQQNVTAATMGVKNPSTVAKSPAKSSIYQTAKLALQVLAIAIGVSTILGTLISIANSYSTNPPENHKSTSVAIGSLKSNENQKVESLFSIVSLGKELPDLRLELESLAEKYKQLKPGIFLVDLDSKRYVNFNSSTPYASASTIKLPVLILFFQDVDAGKIQLDRKLTITKDVIGSGSGGLQYEPIGTQFTALYVATKMITVSDNTATNMLIELLGGKEAVNRRFMELGLESTRIQNPLPDLTGTNTTSPEDLGNLLVKLDSGELVSLRSRDRILDIMQHVVTDTLLPQGLETGAIISHKTGDIKSVLGDAGIIDMPNGKRYIATVLVKRPDNDPQAKEFIQQMSKTAYQYFKYH